MVIDKKKHSDKPRLNQGSSAAIAEPNKIAASTHFDFEGKNLTPYGGLFPVATMLERLGFEKLVNENPDGNAHPARHDHLSIRTGDGVGYLRGVCSPQPPSFCGPGPDADRDPEGERTAGAERVLAVSGLAESELGRTTCVAGRECCWR
jgi:hypothetical protein